MPQLGPLMWELSVFMVCLAVVVIIFIFGGNPEIDMIKSSFMKSEVMAMWSW